MRIVFFGCTAYSKELLLDLLEQGTEIVAIFGIPEYFSISYSESKVKNSNYANLEPIAQVNNIPYYEVDSVDGKRTKDYQKVIIDLNPDVILVLGWYYMVPRRIRELAKLGAWGIHASLLPNYAGGAPLVWAIINGEKETGVTLFRMDDGVDDGDIIAQKSFPIKEDDTIKEVYDKAIFESKTILNRVLVKNRDDITFVPQDKSKIKVYPQRKPEDGEINWSWDTKRIKDFIRAQTKPYPGAFTILNGKKITIWNADVININ